MRAKITTTRRTATLMTACAENNGEVCCELEITFRTKTIATRIKTHED